MHGMSSRARRADNDAQHVDRDTWRAEFDTDLIGGNSPENPERTGEIPRQRRPDGDGLSDASHGVTDSHAVTDTGATTATTGSRATTAAGRDGTDSDADAPPVPRRRKRRRRRVVLISLLVLLLLVGGGVAAGALYLRSVENDVDRVDAFEEVPVESRPDKAEAAKEAMNFLILGSDTRDPANTGGSRSDTIIVAHLTHDRSSAQLISIPRDTWVHIPKSPDGKNGNTNAKINAALIFASRPPCLPSLLFGTCTQVSRGIEMSCADDRSAGRCATMMVSLREPARLPGSRESLPRMRMFCASCTTFGGRACSGTPPKTSTTLMSSTTDRT